MKPGRKIGIESLRILNTLVDKRALDLGELWERVEKNAPSWGKRQLLYKLHNLKRQGYLVARKNNNVSFFHLTPKGRLGVVKYLHLEKLKLAKWDGQWRVVIFDIPESLKKWREYLRAELRRLGFHSLQESVYITPYPVTGELDELLKDWNLRKYFRYITASEIDGEKELKIVFGFQ